MRGIRKRFGPVVALDGVDLSVRRGEVHALIGENGAGKSTLMKVLSGATSADAGTMALGGHDYAPAGPLEARRRGVAMIYQELTLAPDLTVAENLVLGGEPTRFGFVRRSERESITAPILELLAHPALGPDVPVSSLGPGPRQLVEIGRALVGDARVVVLDEPTSSLSAAEGETLDAVIRKLRERQVSVVYISHFLEEVERIADRFTVLRDGATVGGGRVEGTPLERIVEMMVGRELDEVFPVTERAPGAALLELEGMTLHRGEVLGIAGLVGAGRTELLRALYGLDEVRRGEVRVAYQIGGAPPARSIGGRIRQGLGLVSEDRKAEGLALDRSVAENLTLSHAAPFTRFGWLRSGERTRLAEQLVERVGIKVRSVSQDVAELSGGNQQKVAIARLLHQDAEVLLLDEPTRGIDVGSKVEVYRLIGELAAKGKAVLMVSSYLPELLGVCDRIAVMHRGALSEARPADEWTEVSLMDVATRGSAA